MDSQDILQALTPVLGGEAAEIVASLSRDDIDAYYSPGTMAFTAMALKDLAAHLEEIAKDGSVRLMTGGQLVDGRVEFKDRPASVRTGINAAAVKAQFPPAEYPGLYSQTQVKGGVAMKLLPKAG